MQIVMCIGLGAVFLLLGYWVGVGRLQQAIKAGSAERDHKIKSWVRQPDELAMVPLLPPEAIDGVQNTQAEASSTRVIALLVGDLGDLSGTYTRMSVQVLRVTDRSDLAIAVVQAFIFFNKIDVIPEPQRRVVLESEQEPVRRVLRGAGVRHRGWFRPAVLSEAARIERK